MGLLDSEAFEFRFDVGVTQPASSLRLVDLPSVIDLFTSHSTLISVKAQLDQISDGLKHAHILELFIRNPRRMGDLLLYQETSITASELISLFQPNLSPIGHIQREAEEAVIVYFSEFVQHVEGNTFDRSYFH